MCLRSGFSSFLFIRCNQLKREWGSHNPPGPRASIYITLLRMQLKPRSIPHSGHEETAFCPGSGFSCKAASIGLLCWWNIAARATDSQHKNMIWMINLKLYYSRVKVYIACSHGDNTIAPLLHIEMGLFNQCCHIRFTFTSGKQVLLQQRNTDEWNKSETLCGGKSENTVFIWKNTPFFLTAMDCKVIRIKDIRTTAF